MREKVAFKRQVIGDDGTGGNTVYWHTYYAPKSVEVREIRPSTDVIAQQSNVQMILEVKMRYNPAMNIQHGDYIEWRGFSFTNLAFKVDRVNRWIWITAFSEMEETSREDDRTGDMEELNLEDVEFAPESGDEVFDI